MSETVSNEKETSEQKQIGVVTRRMFGRRQIFTDVEAIKADNVAAVVRQAYATHSFNRSEIEYLYKYYKGDQPILSRVKEIRPEINNKIVENRALSIVDFRVGYTVGNPVQYISSVSDDSVSEAIAKLNDMMRIRGKASKDKELVTWQMIAGTAYRMVIASENPADKVPFKLYSLDPRNAFVIYRNDYTKEPLAGVTYTVDMNQNVTFYVYTKDREYVIRADKVEQDKANNVGLIPIIEYPLNLGRLGAFETVLGLLDALNNLDSNSLDSVEQFVQSLMVVYNANFDESVTANSIREAGMVILKSVGDAKADIKVISEVLNQSETQIFKDKLIHAINEIVGMPSQGSGSTSDSSNNKAAEMKNGWASAETRAKDFEAEFKEPEQRTLELVSVLCRSLSELEFDADDVDIKFTRRNYDSLLEKSQTLVTLLNAPNVHPQCAYEASGLFIDTQEAYNMGIAWQEEKERKATKNVNVPDNNVGNTEEEVSDGEDIVTD